MTWRAAFCWIAGGTPTNPGRSTSGTGDQPGILEAAGIAASGMACCKGITPQVIGRCVRYPDPREVASTRENPSVARKNAAMHQREDGGKTQGERCRESPRPTCDRL